MANSSTASVAGPVTAGRVLLVDDDQFLLAGYARALQSAGFLVDAVVDGGAARQAIEGKTFDVVISDIALGDVDGLDVLRSARQHDPDLPVVLMTGGPDVRSAIGAVELGANRQTTTCFSAPPSGKIEAMVRGERRTG